MISLLGRKVPAPLIETECSENRSLGKTNDALKPTRNIVRFTMKEYMYIYIYRERERERDR